MGWLRRELDIQVHAVAEEGGGVEVGRVHAVAEEGGGAPLSHAVLRSRGAMAVPTMTVRRKTTRRMKMRRKRRKRRHEPLLPLLRRRQPSSQPLLW